MGLNQWFANGGNVRFYCCRNRWVKTMSPIHPCLQRVSTHVVWRFYGTMAVPSFERLAKRGEDDRPCERTETNEYSYLLCATGFSPPPRGILSVVYHRLAINIPSREGNAARKLCPRSSMHLSKGLDFLPTELKLYTYTRGWYNCEIFDI